MIIEKIKVLKNVFKNINYLILLIIISLLFYSINVTILSWRMLFNFFKMSGFMESLSIFSQIWINMSYFLDYNSYLALIITSLLIGMLFSLLIYKTQLTIKNMQNDKSNILIALGVFLGILAPGCAACGIGIISALGLGAVVINFLPLKGLEISILSILILSYSIYKITDKIENGNACPVKKVKKRTNYFYYT
jgi:hypothetical protein